MVRPSLDPVYPKENGAANDEFSVRSIVSSNISADLCEIDIVLATEDGLRRVCKINPDVLAELLINLSDLAQHVRNWIVARFGELTIAALGVDAVAASSPTGSGKIIMSIQSRTGTVHHFSFNPELSALLRSQMRNERMKPAAAAMPFRQRCNQSWIKARLRGQIRVKSGKARLEHLWSATT